MKVTMRVEGLRDLEAGLLQLKKLGARQVVRAALKAASQPILDAMLRRVRVDEGRLREDLGFRVRMRGGTRNAAFMQSDIGVKKATPSDYETTKAGDRAVGSVPAAYGKFLEFGTGDITPKPFMRPAWIAEGGDRAIDRIKAVLASETERVARRQARAAAKLKRK